MQAVLCQASFRVELREAFGIEFSRLLCLNNMPIKRYVDFLQRRGQLQGYMEARRHCLLCCADLGALRR